ncbi:hypothetical protein SU69_01850 [Thermosipho melanesiensis]|uniref:CRISPR-associated protein, Csh1 family n=2 Tax=Thermosipho melanesiensis TaxID=46541 RepID=A6LJX3_THEM4|nr:hypothetical protein [Thermosipho melanesiensis]ABR30224.1 hypothetical protein Tmel_0354 [Thermosipho melanesiensis BI429]APT73418.1 hypothetical protein BW47_01915 [Thermosipho melanesiensis]OOC37358.1 hypothetical protein SU68_01860 [Thermosipho melanesiensis]OOC39720.1 hypothetical protein SU69_01850 [Thermosipho melanesiensis]OOC39825.1 hypothetical protein SU70_01845 [Thermosipho melanesiensis]
MINQMIEFSKELRDSRFYDLLEEKAQDLVYVIIPPEDKKKFYFVLDEKYYDKVNLLENARKIDDVNDDLREILKNVKVLTAKLPGDEKGNKSIKGNKGTNSYNLFIFQGPKPKNGDFTKKIMLVYNSETLKSFKNRVKEDLLEKLIFKGDEAKFLYEKVNDMSLKVFNKEYEEIYKNIYFVFELENKELYKDFHQKYLKEKVFAVENVKEYGICPICGKKDIISIPGVFHTLNVKKPFLKHLGRKTEYNIMICKDCAFELTTFLEKFLKKFSIFPLLSKKKLRELEIKFLKSSGEKLSFREILEQVFKEVDVNDLILDFYLIIYKDDFVYVDYVSNFRYYYNETNIFEIENYLDKMFDNFLVKNYFGSITIKNNLLAKNIYKYRENIFDFIYRARYDSLSKETIDNIFYDSLVCYLKGLYSEEKNFLKKIEKAFESYKKLNKIFGGDFMEKTEKVETEDLEKIEDSYQYYYLLGKLTRFLLSQSKISNKTHALVEPFINVNSSKVMLERIYELFTKYKHAINFYNEKFDKIFGLILNYFNSGKLPEKVSKNDKFYFFEGYFSSRKL